MGLELPGQFLLLCGKAQVIPRGCGSGTAGRLLNLSSWKASSWSRVSCTLRDTKLIPLGLALVILLMSIIELPCSHSRRRRIRHVPQVRTIGVHFNNRLLQHGDGEASSIVGNFSAAHFGKSPLPCTELTSFGSCVRPPRKRMTISGVGMNQMTSLREREVRESPAQICPLDRSGRFNAQWALVFVSE